MSNTNHSVTPAAEQQVPVPGRPMPVTPEELIDAYAGGYKDPEVVDRWVDWGDE